MYKKLPGPKQRIYYWKKILSYQNQGKRMSMAGTPLPKIPRGSKKYNLIMNLARMKSDKIIQIAKKQYSKYSKVAILLSWYRKGTIREERRKEGRKSIPFTVGFPPKSKFIANLIRHQIINHERGMIFLEKRKGRNI